MFSRVRWCYLTNLSVFLLHRFHKLYQWFVHCVNSGSNTCTATQHEMKPIKNECAHRKSLKMQELGGITKRKRRGSHHHSTWQQHKIAFSFAWKRSLAFGWIMLTECVCMCASKNMWCSFCLSESFILIRAYICLLHISSATYSQQKWRNIFHVMLPFVCEDRFQFKTFFWFYFCWKVKTRLDFIMCHLLFLHCLYPNWKYHLGYRSGITALFSIEFLR